MEGAMTICCVTCWYVLLWSLRATRVDHTSQAVIVNMVNLPMPTMSRGINQSGAPSIFVLDHSENWRAISSHQEIVCCSIDSIDSLWEHYWSSSMPTESSKHPTKCLCWCDSNHSQHPPALDPQKMTTKESENLHNLMCKQFNGKEPHHFQVNLMKAQEEWQDAICQAATGMGKTAITTGPYVLPKNVKRVTVMISPLIRLQNEMVGQQLISVFISHYLSCSECSRLPHLRRSFTLMQLR